MYSLPENRQKYTEHILWNNVYLQVGLCKTHELWEKCCGWGALSTSKLSRSMILIAFWAFQLFVNIRETNPVYSPYSLVRFVLFLLVLLHSHKHHTSTFSYLFRCEQLSKCFRGIIDNHFDSLWLSFTFLKPWKSFNRSKYFASTVYDWRTRLVRNQTAMLQEPPKQRCKNKYDTYFMLRSIAVWHRHCNSSCWCCFRFDSISTLWFCICLG